MDRPLFSTRDLVLWAACFLAAAALVILTGFTSVDGDSALYASISGRLAMEPMSRWVAPEWWGFWGGSTGLFRECPIGVFVLPALAARIGIPAVQAAYAQGLAAEVGALLLIGVLVRRVTSVTDARLAMLLMLVMPIAFIFRIRANHEYPMLFCLALALVAVDGVRRAWGWTLVLAAALTAALLVKGVFVVQVVLGAGLWALCNPARRPGPAARPLIGIAAALALMLAAALAYDAWYAQVTGGPFWIPYWNRQLGRVTVTGATTGVRNLSFYLLRIVWHPAPWSAALVLGAWRWRRGLVAALQRALPSGERRALVFGALFVAAVVGMLFPLSRFAERYAFSASWTTGAIGAVIAGREWKGLDGIRARWTTSSASTALAWLALIILRLVLGPLLPRLQ